MLFESLVIRKMYSRAHNIQTSQHTSKHTRAGLGDVETSEVKRNFTSFGFKSFRHSDFSHFESVLALLLALKASKGSLKLKYIIVDTLTLSGKGINWTNSQKARTCLF